MVKGPLSGVVVLDLTHMLAGPYCTSILYNLGARIIKVERPNGGDESRLFTPFIEGESAFFSALNHGKQSIVLDIKSDIKDKAIFEKLIRQADVLVENFRPGVLPRIGYDENKLEELNPALIVARISGFGKTGPESMRACYDLIAQGVSGLMSIIGENAMTQPLKAGVELGDLAGGFFSAIGICAALFDRTRTGKGNRIGTSLVDCLTALMVEPFSRYSVDGKVPKPSGAQHVAIVPFDVFMAKDKAIIICAATDALFALLCKSLGKAALAKNSKFSNNEARLKHREELTHRMNELLKTKTAQDWLDIFAKNGVPSGPVNTIADVFREPQIQYRKMIAHFSQHDMPDVKFPGNPIKFSHYPDINEYPRGPKLNEHNDEIRAWLDDREK